MTKIGQKSKYKAQYCQELIDYFKENKHYEVGSKGRRIANPPPTFAGFAAKIGIGTTTLQEWKKNNAEFQASYGIAKALQVDFIICNAMIGLAPSNFAQFMLINCHNWSNKTEIKQEAKMTISTADVDSLSAEQIADEVRKLLN